MGKGMDQRDPLFQRSYRILVGRGARGRAMFWVTLGTVEVVAIVL
jgi:hypothetical protein